MASRLAIHFLVQDKAWNIVQSYHEARDTYHSSRFYAILAGSGVPMSFFFDAYSATLFSLPTTFTSIVCGISFGVSAVMFHRYSDYHRRLLLDRPLDRLRNVQGQPLTTDLKLPYIKEALEHLPETFPADVKIEEEALKLIAAMNRSVEL